MTTDRDLPLDPFAILSRLAIAASRGDELVPTVERALEQAALLSGLTAAAIYLWDDQQEVNLVAGWARDKASGHQRDDLEQKLFRGLRDDHDVLAAYLRIGGETPAESFTLPLRHRDIVFGAVIGLHPDDGSLVTQARFLESLAATVALHVVAERKGTDQLSDRDRDKERLGAIIETAVTVNHEINNPLTAILGNVQLLLLRDDELPEELKGKLKTIEASALKIKDVTQRLLELTSARSIHYAEGTTMIDLGDLSTGGTSNESDESDEGPATP